MEKAADLDVAMVMGMGFPAFRGGLIFWADLVGAGETTHAAAGGSGLQVLLQEGGGWRVGFSHGRQRAGRKSSGVGQVGKGRDGSVAHKASTTAQRRSVPPPVFPPFPPADYICKRLAAWAQQFGGTPLAGFFKPCAYLEAAARAGTKLSAGKASASRL